MRTLSGRPERIESKRQGVLGFIYLFIYLFFFFGGGVLRKMRKSIGKHNSSGEVACLFDRGWSQVYFFHCYFLQHKFQLNIDGTVAAYRFPWLLAGGSAVFKQESIYYEHFYSQLVPYQHYIPIEHDLSDLVKKLRWAKKNDKKVILSVILSLSLSLSLSLFLSFSLPTPSLSR